MLNIFSAAYFAGVVLNNLCVTCVMTKSKKVGLTWFVFDVIFFYAVVWQISVSPCPKKTTERTWRIILRLTVDLKLKKTESTGFMCVNEHAGCLTARAWWILKVESPDISLTKRQTTPSWHTHQFSASHCSLLIQHWHLVLLIINSAGFQSRPRAGCQLRSTNKPLLLSFQEYVFLWSWN